METCFHSLVSWTLSKKKTITFIIMQIDCVHCCTVSKNLIIFNVFEVLIVPPTQKHEFSGIIICSCLLPSLDFLWKLILWTWSLRMTLLDTPRKNSDKRERGSRPLEASFWFIILCAQMCYWVQMYVSAQRIWMCACLVFACSSVVFAARDNGNLDVAQAVFPAVVQPYCSSHLFL